ncbi:MAG: hypothetical protein ACOX19_11170 [Fermentimonas sp.]|jgi:hypothetical protein
MKTILLTIALAMMTAVAFGQDNQQAKATDKVQTETQTQAWRGPFFVDEDNNGICDNFENGTRPGRGQGRNARGRYFVDEDNDGICDNFQSGNRPGRGRGQGYGRGAGGFGNFVDNNNDGICDYYQSGVRPGRGRGQGYGRGPGRSPRFMNVTE